MTGPAAACIVLGMPIPRLIVRAFAAFRARLRSWLGVGGLVTLVAVAFVYGLSVEPELAPRFERGLGLRAYRSDIDARTAVEQGKARAAESGKMLMVTFGANWCPDCLTLQRNLRDGETRVYADKHFEMVHIDVGDSKASAAVQRDLGITVHVIPLAVFYSPTGEPVGDTFAGELKSSRHFTSRDIRDFLREVVDYHRIVSPDQRQ
jgi:thioredoxin-related protein